MLTRFAIILAFVCFLACKTDHKENTNDEQKKPNSEMVFDSEKWKTKDGDEYPFRDKMLNELVYNDTVRTLTKVEILEMLGEPDRINEGHLYYLISQTRLALWPVKTKTMVIKLSEDSSIEWIKIHG